MNNLIAFGKTILFVAAVMAALALAYVFFYALIAFAIGWVVYHYFKEKQQKKRNTG